MSDAAPSPCPVVRAQSILQKVRTHGNEWFGIDYNMNLYRGCCHGCIYCDSRSECYRIDDFDQVSVKFDALAILRRELYRRRTRGIVGIGAMSDTYNPFEDELRVTRGALELLEEFGFYAEDFGGGALVVRQAPFDVDPGDIEDTLLEIGGRLLTTGRADPSAARDELFHTMACKAAIKGGWRTSPQELEKVAGAVMRGEVKYCPHGRPVAIELTRKDLEKQFRRA